MKTNVRAILRVGAVGAAAAVFGLVTVAGQAPAPAGAPPAPPARTKSTYQPPKTAWGEPDIGGMFNFSYVGTVPLERPCQPQVVQAPGAGGAPGGRAGAAPGVAGAGTT